MGRKARWSLPILIRTDRGRPAVVRARAAHEGFGVTTAESTATGLPVYSAGAGLRNTVLGILGAYDISRHWVALWSAEWHRLLGDTRDSPYTHDTNNFYHTIGMTYRF